jgi:hypothetical protein
MPTSLSTAMSIDRSAVSGMVILLIAKQREG